MESEDFPPVACRKAFFASAVRLRFCGRIVSGLRYGPFCGAICTRSWPDIVFISV